MDLATPDPAAMNYLSARDPRLGKLIEAMPFPACHSSEDLYYDLVSCLVDQQIHYRSKNNWFRQLLDLFPGGYPHPRQLLALPRETVLDVKISARKHGSLCALATWWLQQGEGTAWGELTDEAVRAQLSGLPGVGTWTTEMILLFTLGRPDILPPNDYGLKKAITAHYGLTAEANLPENTEQLAEAWRPYRSLACRYLWASPNPSAKIPLSKTHTP
jgi:DNA-3-methyladenine glycosylase II